MHLKTLVKKISEKLSTRYDSHEAQAVAHLFVESFFGVSAIDIILDKEVDSMDEVQLNHAIQKLTDGTPVQYVLGFVDFMDARFRVNENVLIPRPETEELVQWILDENGEEKRKVIDIGTGSGCIPVSLKIQRPDWQVSALDVSSEALHMARSNAGFQNADVAFFEVDILNNDLPDSDYEIIISNPPYVTNSEKQLMHDNVLDHEPHLALFVADDQALLFYNRIADLAKSQLVNGGKLYFEINEAFGDAVRSMMQEKGFKKIKIRKDINGKYRMASGVLGG